jgi:hypothetical protein
MFAAFRFYHNHDTTYALDGDDPIQMIHNSLGVG